MTGTTKVQLDATEVKALFEQVGAPADAIDSFVEIFESAVATNTAAQVEIALAEKVADLEAKAEAHITFLNEKSEEHKVLIEQEADAKLTAYMEHFAAEFVAENKPVIESNIKSTMFTSLMEGMQKLFVEHNLALSDEQTDVLAVTESKLTETQTALSEVQNQVIELTKVINEGKRSDIIDSAVEKLTESQAEKVRELVADIAFSEAFEGKVQRVVEAFSNITPVIKPETTDVVTEVTNPDALNTPEAKQVTPAMSSYLQAAGKQATKFR
ncbi:hypothetical protein D3C80_129800 [compost metagenome]